MRWSEDYLGDLKRLLASPNICSKRWVHEQYDSMVQTNTASGPGGLSEAGVIRIKGANRGLAMALDGNGRWCYLDPKLGAMHAVAESARNVACAGGAPGGGHQLPELRQSREAAHHGPVLGGHRRHERGLPRPWELRSPGGNVSFYNETLGEGIYPTPVIGVVGIIDDVGKVVGSSFQHEGQAVLLLGAADRNLSRKLSFGSSEYAWQLLGKMWGRPPAIDLEQERRLQSVLIQLAAEGLLDSAKDVSEGGLAVTLAENASREESAPRSTSPLARRIARLRCSENLRVGCWFPATRRQVARIREVAGQHKIDVQQLGRTARERLTISIGGKPVISCAVAESEAGLGGALESALHAGTETELEALKI